MDQNVLIILCVYLTQADHRALQLFSFIKRMDFIESNRIILLWVMTNKLMIS